MKKFIFICFSMILMFEFVSVVESAAAEKAVSVSVPTFRVQINGTTVDNKTAQYPLLFYKNITYMPMTHDYCNLLGLESDWTKEEGLFVALRDDNSIPTVTEYSTEINNPSRVTAHIVSTPITINNRKIDNTKEPYPFLRYRDITYFPLTFQFLNKDFNIYTNFLPDAGLAVYSENKFFYKYYPDGSELQNTDLRISSILYLITAINVSDGTENYPTNNVKQYYYERPGVALLPDYKGIKYYGYLPDGKGGLRANVDSRLSIGDIITTEISNLENPIAVQVELSFNEYYSPEFPEN
ncbi:MAG: hypothetical protein PHV71_00170 [Eubacteriales bacterium]|nr:hypothetical protein [Eubacteriales bacterium]MDD3198754.1 hypothetical protein [Eubacteriales bacterium]MDD4121463.1 hypothetical protein [Eubacteriales bacterium]MDD4629000.1 hypothetical protein [Eubacteriales bacterium]